MALFDYLAPQYMNDPSFPVLVSWPRTGSHWFRMIMELYLQEPCLVRTFFYHNPKSFWGIHKHDINTQIRNRDKVIYLYRNPIDTIYSEMVYNQKKFSEHIDHYINLYAVQVQRWKYNTPDIKAITHITYEGMKNDVVEEVSRVLEFLNKPVDKDLIAKCAEQVNKERVKEKTQHDTKVICRADGYENFRDKFRAEYGDYILEEFKKKDERLVW